MKPLVIMLAALVLYWALALTVAYIQDYMQLMEYSNR